VGYLLQRMETFRGLAILTTNYRNAFDPAFTRRLRTVVSFPYPDPALRRTAPFNSRPSLGPAQPDGGEVKGRERVTNSIHR
jgi:hypothetical protein